MKVYNKLKYTSRKTHENMNGAERAYSGDARPYVDQLVELLGPESEQLAKRLIQATGPRDLSGVGDSIAELRTSLGNSESEDQRESVRKSWIANMERTLARSARPES